VSPPFTFAEEPLEPGEETQVQTMVALERALRDVLAAARGLEPPHRISATARLTVLGAIVAEALVEALYARDNPDDPAFLDAWWALTRRLTDFHIWLHVPDPKRQETPDAP
jgi:hypothetical protein